MSSKFSSDKFGMYPSSLKIAKSSRLINRNVGIQKSINPCFSLRGRLLNIAVKSEILFCSDFALSINFVEYSQSLLKVESILTVATSNEFSRTGVMPFSFSRDK